MTSPMGERLTEEQSTRLGALLSDFDEACVDSDRGDITVAEWEVAEQAIKDFIDQTVREAVEQEREACAQLAAPKYGEFGLREDLNIEREFIENAIRARSSHAPEGSQRV